MAGERQTLEDISDDARFGANLLNASASTQLRDSDEEINEQQHRNFEFVQRRLEQKINRRDRAIVNAMQTMEQDFSARMDQLTTSINRIVTVIDENLERRNASQPADEHCQPEVRRDESVRPRQIEERGRSPLRDITLHRTRREESIPRRRVTIREDEDDFRPRRAESLPRHRDSARHENLSHNARQNTHRIALRHDAMCTDDEIAPDMTVDQYKMVIKHMKMPVLTSVDNYKNFKIEFDRYLIDTNYPAPYMRMRYLQAMAEGCQEAKSFEQEMKRVGAHYSYRKLVEEADKYFGQNHRNTGVLMRKLTHANQKADESLSDWYSRMFRILQDILDRLDPNEYKPFKLQAAAQLVEGLFDKQLAKDVTLYQVQRSDIEGTGAMVELRDVYNLIIKTNEVNNTLDKGTSRARQVQDIAANFARVRDAAQSSSSASTPAQQKSDENNSDSVLQLLYNEVKNLRNEMQHIKRSNNGYRNQNSGYNQRNRNKNNSHNYNWYSNGNNSEQYYQAQADYYATSQAPVSAPTGTVHQQAPQPHAPAASAHMPAPPPTPAHPQGPPPHLTQHQAQPQAARTMHREDIPRDINATYTINNPRISSENQGNRSMAAGGTQRHGVNFNQQGNGSWRSM